SEVLKSAWGYKGYVMSDWGAVPDWGYALKGLDQESGSQMDVFMWGDEAFTDRLRKAYEEGKLPKERLSEMVRRILRSAYAIGIDRWGPAAHGRHGQAQRNRPRNRAPGHRAPEERWYVAAHNGHAVEDRGDRWPRPGRGHKRDRFGRSSAGRRICGRDQDRTGASIVMAPQSTAPART